MMNETPYHETIIGKWWAQRQREYFEQDGCPDCESTDGEWVDGTYYEQGEWRCNECNPSLENMFDDTRYDEYKENQR